MKEKPKSKFTLFVNKLLLPVNSVVLCIAVSSIIWIFAYKLILVDIPPLFYKAQEVGEIFFNLLSSVVASCIFYYFVVYLEQRRIAREMYPVLRERLKTFNVNIFNVMLGMHNLKGIPPSFDLPTREKLLQLSQGIKLSSRPPEIFGNPPTYTDNWFEYFAYLFQSDNYISSLLYAHVNFLPSKIVAKLDEIQFSPFQRALKHYQETKYSDNLSDLINPFHYYLQCLDDLAKMAESELK